MTESQTASRRPEYLGDPTIARIAMRPSWIAALLLAFLVAAGFAWLGRWQLDNAIRTDTFDSVEFETPRPLSELAEPGVAVTEDAAGAVATTSGSIRADDLQIVAPRDNDGKRGAWVVGHLVIPADDQGSTAEANDEGDAGTASNLRHLVVAIGWAPSVSAAEQTIDTLAAGSELDGDWALEGRFMPPEGSSVPAVDEDPSLIQTMLPGYLVNLWNGYDGGAYAGYLVLHPTGETQGLLDAVGLDSIDSVAPEPPEAVSWLNVFYAVEWIVFAGFAVFLWYRLVRDAWEKEHEIQLLRAEEAEGMKESTLAEPSDSEE